MPWFRRISTGLALLTLIGPLGGCEDPPKPTQNLYHSVHSGNLDQIKRHLFWKTDVNQPGPDGNFPLHVAVSQGRVTIARELIKHGAKLDVRDRLGRTPLHVALASGKVPAAALLVDQGADDDPQGLLFDLVQTQALDRDTLAFLIGRGVDIDAPDPTGQPPLLTAVRAGDLRLAKRLIGAGANVNLTNASGATALEIAEAQGDEAMLNLLQQYGAER